MSAMNEIEDSVVKALREFFPKPIPEEAFNGLVRDAGGGMFHMDFLKSNLGTRKIIELIRGGAKGNKKMYVLNPNHKGFKAIK